MRDDDREQMLEQLRSRGIRDELVLEAFATVPREAFLPQTLASRAYEDGPLPIGEGQTISQPYVVAFALEALELTGGERVLEIGTGSGYAAALLARIASEVTSVERIHCLGEAARRHLSALGVTNVHVEIGDGTLGCPARAPFDAIAVAAAGPHVPDSLRVQLAIGGRLVMPVGARGEQVLVRTKRVAPDRWVTDQLAGVSFVPLIGEHGFTTAASSVARRHVPWMQ
jgi:protein-L-isoaspartate(D-aspartate) O-methyltransferase